MRIRIQKPFIRRLRPLVAGSILTALPLAEAAAQSGDYTPMDPIPEVVELPDPCDNPTTRMWGPEDVLGNLNYLTPERVSENLSLIWRLRARSRWQQAVFLRDEPGLRQPQGAGGYRPARCRCSINCCCWNCAIT